MAVDKVKPLKIEDGTSGTQIDFVPREADPAEDYLASKGLSFENLDTFLAEKVGGVLGLTVPACSYKPTYHISGADDGEINFLEIFKGATQTTINRIVRVDITYDGGRDPTVEAWKIYDNTDGTTVLRTITLTHTWVSGDITKTTEVIT